MAYERGLVDCLLVGAMKSGTTSLMADLALHPGVYVPTVKEPHFLSMNQEPIERIAKLYEELFARAAPAQLRCDGSTGYSKRPTVEGVAERALKVAGPALKIIYIVRDPVERALSHHYHMYREGATSADFAESVRTHPELIQYGRYAWQLEPWVATFGLTRICVVRFDEYVADRPAVLDRVFRFLEVGPLKEYGAAPLENAGESGGVARPLVRRVLGNATHHSFYKLYVRPNLPDFIRRAYSSIARTPAPKRPPLPSPEFLAELRAVFAEDVGTLTALMNWSEQPWRGSPGATS